MTLEEVQLLVGRGRGLEEVGRRMEGKEKWNGSFREYKCYRGLAEGRNMRKVLKIYEI